MIPTDFRQAITDRLRNHFEVELAANFRRLGVNQRMSSGEFARAVEDCLAGCLPVYLADGDLSRPLPTVETEVEGRPITAREARELVATAVKTAMLKPSTSIVEVESTDAAGQVKRAKIVTRRRVQA